MIRMSESLFVCVCVCVCVNVNVGLEGSDKVKGQKENRFHTHM